MKRPTFKVYSIISTKSGVIAGGWQYGKTDSEVMKIKHAAARLAHARKPVTTGSTAYDVLGKRHGAYRWTFEGHGDYFNKGINVTVWAVREYND